MKEGLLLTLFLVIFDQYISAQCFAPLGATWYYTHTYLGGTDINQLTVVDTSVIIQGKRCAKISKTISFCSPKFEYLYCENDIVFRYNQNNHQFDTLYDFNLIAGQGWDKNIIDSVVYVYINGFRLKGLYLNGETFGGPTLQRIGHPASFISDNPSCDPADGGWLRCYSDGIIGSYSIVKEDCALINSGVQDVPQHYSDWFYHPSEYSLILTAAEKPAMMLILNAIGHVVFTESGPLEKTDIGFLPVGIYFAVLMNKNHTTGYLKFNKF